MPDELTIPNCCSQDFKLIFDGEYDMPMDGPPATIFDIGANVGMFTAWAARLWPDAKIKAFEPWPENIAMAKKNTEDLPNVELWGCAVRAETGLAPMFDNGYPPLHSFHNGVPGRTRDVKCIDAAEIGSAEFVKIDTEGSELEIIKRLDLTDTRYIAIEAHTRADANQIIGFLCSRGFALHNMYGSGSCCLLLKFLHRSKVEDRKKLFVAVPTYSGSPSIFWQCLMRLMDKPPVDLQIKNIDGDSLVSRARNSLTAEFLKSDCSHMLFIDSDLIFSPDHVGRIMEHEADVVGGFYPKKMDGPLNWVCNAALQENKPDANGLQEVRYMGTGFLRVSRAALLRMITELGEDISYNPDHSPELVEYDLWPVGVHKGANGRRRYLSEDWFFCQRWLDLGGKVYGDTKIVLKHIGKAAYPLKSQMLELLTPKP